MLIISIIIITVIFKSHPTELPRDQQRQSLKLLFEEGKMTVDV